MTKITIEVDGPASITPQTSGSTDLQSSTATPAVSSGGNDGGGAPAADASHVGPVPQISSADPSKSNPAFNPDGAISAGAAPAHLMGGAE
jgi:hypothetical protein